MPYGGREERIATQFFHRWRVGGGCFLAATVAFEGLRSGASVSVAWDKQFECADADFEGAAVVSVAVAFALWRALVGSCVKVLGQFFFHNQLQQRLKRSAHRLVSFPQSLLLERGLVRCSCMACPPNNGLWVGF